MANETRIKDLLKRFDLRKTPTRTQILELYLQHDYALAHRDIEDALSTQFDRVTIYRTLHAFEEKGLIHRVYDGSSAIKYAICGVSCSADEHDHNHVHFTCTTCQKTYCLEHTDVPKIKLPQDFEADDVFLFARGTCEHCKV